MVEVPRHEPRLNGAVALQAFENDLRNAAAAAGLPPLPAKLRLDGKPQRFKKHPKDGKRSMRLIGHADGVPNVSVLDMSKDTKEPVFKYKGRAPDGMDAARIAEEAAANKAKHEAAEAEKHATAAKTAKRMWDAAKPASPDHGYLKAKGIQPHLARQIGDFLLIPVTQDDVILGYQQIWPDGKRQFAAGTPARGGYCIIGELPETGGTALMAEGFATGATLHEATGLPVIVAFFADNLLPVAKRFQSAPFEVIIAADDDAGRPDNPGLTKARQAAGEADAKVAVPDFGQHRKANCTDFNDLARERGLDAVKECIERAKCVERTPRKESGRAADFASKAESAESAESRRPAPCVTTLTGARHLSAGLLKDAESSSDEWPHLEPLAKKEPKQEYPVEAFPEILKDAIIAASTVMNTPVEMAAMSALGSLSLAGQGLADVCRSEDLKLYSPIGVYTACVAPSGSRKSGIDNLFTAEIKGFEKERTRELQPEIERSISELAAWNAERDGISAAIKNAAKGAGKKSVEELKRSLVEHDVRKPKVKLAPALLQGDATTEARQRMMANGWPTTGIIESDAGVILGSHSMKAENLTNTAATFTKIWSGESFRIDRIGRETVFVRDVRLTMSIQLQRTVIEELAAKNGGGARDIGLFARILIAEPDIPFGDRPFIEARISELEPVNKRIRELLEIELPWNEDGQGIKPRALHFSPQGKEAWVEAYNAIQREEGADGEYAEIRDASSKGAENIARIAALFHVFEVGPKGSISAENVRRAEAIVRWHLGEYRRFFVDVALTPEEREAEKLERWLLKYCREKDCLRVPRSAAHRGFGGSRKKGGEKLDKALGILQENGRARLLMNGKQKWIEVRPSLIRGEECPF